MSLFVVVVVLPSVPLKKKIAFFSIEEGYFPWSPPERIKKNITENKNENLLKRQLEDIM